MRLVLHGVGGIVGAILTAFFASNFIMGDKRTKCIHHQLWVQVEGIGNDRILSSIVNLHYLKVIDLVIGIHVLESDDERMGLNLSQHGERVE